MHGVVGLSNPVAGCVAGGVDLRRLSQPGRRTLRADGPRRAGGIVAVDAGTRAATIPPHPQINAIIKNMTARLLNTTSGNDILYSEEAEQINSVVEDLHQIV